MRAPLPVTAAVSAPPRLGLGALLVLVSVTACTSIRPPAKNPMAWPLPPDKPRVRFVRAFGSEDDLRTGFGMTLKRIFVPRDPGLLVVAPTSVALTRDEKRLIVASGTGKRVLEINLETGSVTPLAASEGTRPKQPFAAVTDDTDNLYVSDTADRIVWVYDPSGKLVTQIGKGILTRPTGLAIDRRRQVLYVVNAGNPKGDDHTVEVFSLKGAHIRRIGKRGPGPGEFFVPSHATVGRDGTLYVSDVLNARVHAFGPDGDLLGMVGQPGTGAPGLFDKIKGVAVDASGNLHVADSATSIIQMFNAKLQPLMAYGGFGQNAEFLLQLPSGVAIDSRNNIFVADYGANRIVQYQLFNTDASEATKSASPAAKPTR